VSDVPAEAPAAAAPPSAAARRSTPAWGRVLWALYALFVALLVVSAGVGIVRVLLRGGPLNPANDPSLATLTPIDPVNPDKAALRRCHADLDGLYHQLRERVVTLGMAVRNLDPGMLEKWQRWSATWRAELGAVSVRCSLEPAPTQPALAALAEAHATLRAAEERYLAALAELARDESHSLTAAAASLKAAKDALGRAP